MTCCSPLRLRTGPRVALDRLDQALARDCGAGRTSSSFASLADERVRVGDTAVLDERSEADFTARPAPDDAGGCYSTASGPRPGAQGDPVARRGYMAPVSQPPCTPLRSETALAGGHRVGAGSGWRW